MWKLCVIAIVLATTVGATTTGLEVGSKFSLSPSNFDEIVMDPTKDVFVKFFAPWCSNCVRMADAWKDLAVTYTNTSDVVIAELDADAHHSTAATYGVTSYPTMKLFLKNDKSGLLYEGRRDVPTFKSFLQSHGVLQAGTEPVVTPGEVFLLDPSTFHYIVNDPSKDVFVKFFAPWCGHCKRMANAWKELAMVLKDVPHIVIAEINGSEHRPFNKKYGVRGYPTMLLFTKTDKSGEMMFDFSQKKDPETWIAFLSEHGVDLQ
jgi:protein disulfide-isomerase A6